MQPHLPAKPKQSGFSATVVLLVVVVGAIAIIGLLLYQHRKPTTNNTATTNTQTTTRQQNTISTQPAPDPYAGWKSYCDTFYHYCFKYPSDWTLTVNSMPKAYCDTGGVELTDSAKTVYIDYNNNDPSDNGPRPFYPVSITTTTDQALSIVGGYLPSSNATPLYQTLDSSILKTYPLTVGQQSQFPIHNKFTDPNTGSHTCRGSLTADTPSATNNPQAWFNTDAAKTSLLILKSLSYRP